MSTKGVTSPDGHCFLTAFHCNLNTPFQLDWLSSEVSGSSHFCPHYGCQASNKSSCLQSTLPTEPSPQLPLFNGVLPLLTFIPKFSFTFRFLIKFALTEFLNYSAKPSSSLSNKPNFSRKKKPNFILTRHLNTVEWWHTPVIPALGRLKQEDHEIWATY